MYSISSSIIAAMVTLFLCYIDPEYDDPDDDAQDKDKGNSTTAKYLLAALAHVDLTQ